MGARVVGFLDDLLHTVEGPLDLGVGVVNGAVDGTHLVGDVIDGKWNDALDDGRKLMGDAADIGSGLASLGFNVGGMPSAFEGSKSLSADSKVIQAALMAIAGLKLTTGTGTPYNGDEFRDSASRLEHVFDSLYDAKPHPDRWDGTASQVYQAVNASHYRCANLVEVADANVASVLDREAEQVRSARNTLDGVSEGLSAYDLATAWMNLVPGGKAVKLAADLAAVAAAIPVCTTTLEILAAKSFENSMQIRDELDKYADATKDTTGDPSSCEIFPVPSRGVPQPGSADDKGEYPDPLPEPGANTPPSRSLPETKYTPPELPEEPQVGPQAIPYGAPAPAIPAAPPPPANATHGFLAPPVTPTPTGSTRSIPAAARVASSTREDGETTSPWGPAATTDLAMPAGGWVGRAPVTPLVDNQETPHATPNQS